MRSVIVALLLLFIAGCEALPIKSNHASGQPRYLCYTYDYPPEHVLTLPVPTNLLETETTGFGFADVWFQGEVLPAKYERTGLSQFWAFDDDAKLYVKVDPDGDAQYWDFRGAAEGEMRKPEAVFECSKRN